MFDWLKGKGSAPGGAPATEDDVAEAIRQIGEAQRAITLIEAGMNATLATAKSEAEAKAKPHQEAIAGLIAGVRGWCEANRPALTDGGRVKSHTFTTGTVSWRAGKPSVAIADDKAVLDRLIGLLAPTQRLAFKRLLTAFNGAFVRVKTEIDRTAMLKDRERAAKIEGVAIVSGAESFIVEPFETKLAASSP